MLRIIRNTVAATFLVVLTACATGGGNPFVGTWDTMATSPLGDQASVWTIADDGTGVMASEMGDQIVDGIVVEGNEVSFVLEVDAGGQFLRLSFSGVIEGDSLNGAFASDFGDFAVTGTRQ
jgi:hypothetical protein